MGRNQNAKPVDNNQVRATIAVRKFTKCHRKYTDINCWTASRLLRLPPCVGASRQNTGRALTKSSADDCSSIWNLVKCGVTPLKCGANSGQLFYSELLVKETVVPAQFQDRFKRTRGDRMVNLRCMRRREFTGSMIRIVHALPFDAQHIQDRDTGNISVMGDQNFHADRIRVVCDTPSLE